MAARLTHVGVRLGLQEALRPAMFENSPQPPPSPDSLGPLASSTRVATRGAHSELQEGLRSPLGPLCLAHCLAHGGHAVNTCCVNEGICPSFGSY